MNTTGVGGGRCPKIVANGDMGEGVCSNGDVTTVFPKLLTFRTYEIIFLKFPLPSAYWQKQLK